MVAELIIGILLVVKYSHFLLTNCILKPGETVSSIFLINSHNINYYYWRSTGNIFHLRTLLGTAVNPDAGKIINGKA